MKHISLYIHIPFCVRKCLYCDFTSFPDKTDRIEDYLHRLECEMDEAVSRFGDLAVDTLFLGGGTPSLLGGDDMKRLMDAAAKRFSIAPGAEITCEANPGTLDPEKMRAYRAAGINRLSIGVQAFDDRLLRALGRIHTCDEAKRAVLMAQDALFDNLSVDLMYALPGQSLEDWQSTLQTAVGLPIRHISCYSLIVEDGTPMKALADSKAVVLPDEETTVGMQHTAEAFLKDYGFERYEISNYAQRGYESRHNMVYWTRGDYLGLGCAAHSLMNGARFANTASLEDYLAGKAGEPPEALTERDIYEERVMLGLRTKNGVPAAILPKKTLERLVRGGLMTAENGRARVTQAGGDVLNAIILELIRGDSARHLKKR